MAGSQLPLSAVISRHFGCIYCVKPLKFVASVFCFLSLTHRQLMGKSSLAAKF
ncbi:unnamed protein product, partial [Ceratitis capitata]